MPLNEFLDKLEFVIWFFLGIVVLLFGLGISLVYLIFEKLFKE